MSNLRQVTPFMHVADLDQALAFFNGVLGFETGLRHGPYAYIHRAAVGFRLTEAPGMPGDRRTAYYIDVHDVDALYAELKAKLDQLPAGSAYPPTDRDWGMRELMVLAPDGNFITFGQALTPHAEN